MTWAVPVAVFFTSIIGWQYFVGYRSVRDGECYVQYMDDALFNCVLQVGYFWITLTAMISLYTGIYQVALQLNRRYEHVTMKPLCVRLNSEGLRFPPTSVHRYINEYNGVSASFTQRNCIANYFDII